MLKFTILEGTEVKLTDKAIEIIEQLKGWEKERINIENMIEEGYRVLDAELGI